MLPLWPQEMSELVHDARQGQASGAAAGMGSAGGAPYPYARGRRDESVAGGLDRFIAGLPHNSGMAMGGAPRPRVGPALGGIIRIALPSPASCRS